MSKSLLRTNEEIEEIYRNHSKMLYRVAYVYMKNSADSEDAVQQTFFELIKKGPLFESQEHEKAWLIRVITNICKNKLKHWWRRNENIDDISEIYGYEELELDETLRIVMELPDKYKIVVYLYYYDGFNTVEIAKILKKPQSTIRNYLHEARNILRERLGDGLGER